MTVRPSKLELYTKCRGSLPFNLNIPDELQSDSEFALRGRAAHALAATMIKARKEDLPVFKGVPLLEREGAPDPLMGHVERDDDRGFLYEDLLDGVAPYVRYALQLIDFWDDGEVWIEERFPIRFMDGYKGTPDLLVVSRKRRTAILVDYKDGAGVVTDAIPQGHAYIFGVADAFPEIDRFFWQVFQPNVYGVGGRMTVPTLTTRAEIPALEQYYTIVLSDPNPKLTMGRHCHASFCSAKLMCPELMGFVDQLQTAFTEDNMDDFIKNNVVRMLALEPALKAALKQARSIAYENAMQGNPIDGTKLVATKRSAGAWIDKKAVNDLLARNASNHRNLTHNPEALRTPKQVADALAPLMTPETMVELRALIKPGEKGQEVALAEDRRDSEEPRVGMDVVPVLP